MIIEINGVKLTLDWKEFSRNREYQEKMESDYIARCHPWLYKFLVDCSKIKKK